MVWNVGKIVSAVPEMTSSPGLSRANIARARLLKMHYEAKVGHIGGNLSALDAILHLRGDPGTVYCLLSDGECQEGSIWEAAMFLHHRRLANLVVLVDVNGLQGFGSTRDVASLEPLAPKFRGFGLAVEEIDGHSSEA